MAPIDGTSTASEATHFRRTVGRLAQFRPFGDGALQVDFVRAQIVQAAAFEAEEAGFESFRDCQEACAALWGLTVEVDELRDTCRQLVGEGRLIEREGRFWLTDGARREIAETIQTSKATEAAAFSDWEKAVERVVGHVDADQMADLRDDLVAWLQRLIAHYGVEAAMVLYPEDERSRAFFTQIDDLGFDFLPIRSEPLATIRATALPLFIRNPTLSQRRYLGNFLTTAYMVAVFTIDPAAERMVAGVTRGQRIYLDTNVLFAACGLNRPDDLSSVTRVLDLSKRLGFELCVTPWTIEEMRQSVRRSREELRRLRQPPRALAGLAASLSNEETIVTAYWRKFRETGISVDDFCDLHEQVEAHLQRLGIGVVDAGCRRVDANQQAVEEQMSLIGRIPGGDRKTDNVRLHDVKHRILIEQLRGDGNRRFSNAGYWFLTRDSVLVPYGLAERPHQDVLPFAVSLSAWAHVVRGFTARTEDYDRTLVDLLDTPAVRPRGVIGPQAITDILGRINVMVEDSSEEVATRVLVDTARMVEIEEARGDERTSKIDLLITEKQGEIERQLREQADALAAERQARAEADRRAADESVARAASEQRVRALAQSRADEARRADAAERQVDATRSQLVTLEEQLQVQKDAQQREKVARKRAEQQAKTQATEIADLAKRIDRRDRLMLAALLWIAAVVVGLVPIATRWANSGWPLVGFVLIAGGLISLGVGLGFGRRWGLTLASTAAGLMGVATALHDMLG